MKSESQRETARLRSAKWYSENKGRAAESAARYRAANVDAIRSSKRAAYLAQKDTPCFKAELAARTAAAKPRNTDYDRRYRAKNAARLSVLKAEWRAVNKGLMATVKRSYKARRRAQESKGDSARLIFQWVSAAIKICLWCQSDCSNDYHIDHFHPLSKGGHHSVSNLAIACPTCNLEKNALTPADFCQRRGLDFNAINNRQNLRSQTVISSCDLKPSDGFSAPAPTS